MADPRERREDETMAEYGARLSSMGISPSPVTGTMLGTNYNFQPSYQGGGTLSLGWDKVPGVGAGINFDPSAGFPYVSDYDIQAQFAPQKNLSLTAGLQSGYDLAPDPYLDAAVKGTGALKGLNLYGGTDLPSQATYTSGGLGLSKISGGPTQAGFATEISPGVTGYIGSGQGGNVGVTASGAWEDIGKTGRQLWGGIKDAVGNIISPAGADEAVPEVAVAPSMQGVDYSKALADVGMAEVPVDEKKSFSISDYIPTFSTLDKIGIDPILGLLDLEQGSVTREKQKAIEDLSEHGLITGEEADQYKTDTWMNDLSYSNPKSLAAAAGLVLGAIPAQMLDELSLEEGYKSGMANIRGLTETPNTQLDAVIDLVNLGVMSRQDVKDSIPEMKSQVDTFSSPLASPDIKAQDMVDAYRITPSEDVNLAGMPFAGAVTGAEALINEAPFVSANPLSVLAKTGMMSNLANFDAGPAVQNVFDTLMPTAQAAPVTAPSGPSAADIERQKQAAINERLAQQATARQQEQQAAAARAQAASAAQAQAAQAKARAVLASAASRDRGGPSTREINAAREVMSGVDTFGSGGQVDRVGPVGGRGGQGPGGRGYGGGHHGR